MSNKPTTTSSPPSPSSTTSPTPPNIPSLPTTTNNNTHIPQISFGMYKISSTPSISIPILLDAISTGYRHFDSASFYSNESILGEAIRQSNIPRCEFFLSSKVWNDAQKEGRAAVRRSFEKSVRDLTGDDDDDEEGYLDLYSIHWPVPGCHTETYKELEMLFREGRIRNIGISNYDATDYATLLSSGITIKPTLNQIEVSPFMYRPTLISYFQSQHNILIGAFKALHRGTDLALQNATVVSLSRRYDKTPAQILLRWSCQKGFVTSVKTARRGRMVENLNVFDFRLSEEDMVRLDGLTREEDVRMREVRERETKLMC